MKRRHFVSTAVMASFGAAGGYESRCICKGRRMLLIAKKKMMKSLQLSLMTSGLLASAFDSEHRFGQRSGLKCK